MTMKAMKECLAKKQKLQDIIQNACADVCIHMCVPDKMGLPFVFGNYSAPPSTDTFFGKS